MGRSFGFAPSTLSEMMLTDSNFVIYAAKHYENPECHTTEEFVEDLNKLKYLKKIFKRYRDTGEINIRLTLNYVIIFYNLFGVEASTNMLFFKLKDYADVLKPFLTMLNYMPKNITVGKETSPSSDIVMDEGIVRQLRNI